MNENCLRVQIKSPEPRKIISKHTGSILEAEEQEIEARERVELEMEIEKMFKLFHSFVEEEEKEEEKKNEDEEEEKENEGKNDEEDDEESEGKKEEEEEEEEKMISLNNCPLPFLNHLGFHLTCQVRERMRDEMDHILID